MSTSALLEAALDYAGRGWPVFPLHTPRFGNMPLAKVECSCGKACESIGKHPRTLHGVKDATTDEAQIREWWQQWPDANIGIATGGVTGPIVLDVDNHPGRPGYETLDALLNTNPGVPDTPIVNTGSGGQHYYYASSGPLIPNDRDKGLGIGLEVKSSGAYVVAAPSLHASGKRYAWSESASIDEFGLAPFPTWMLERLNAAHAVTKPAVKNVETDFILEGTRNNTLTSIAGSMRRQGLSPEAIEAALQVINRERCQPAMGEREVHAIANGMGRYQPGPNNTTSYPMLPLAVSTTEPQPEARSLPQIKVNERQLRDMTKDALDALTIGNEPPTLFVRGHKLVRVTEDKAAGPLIEEFNVDMMTGRLARDADFYTEQLTLLRLIRTTAKPPTIMVRDILALGEWPFPRLDGIIECPTLRPDGTVLEQPGYDLATRLYLAPSAELKMLPVSSNPTPGEQAEALAVLDEVFCDFAFDSQASKANAQALLITGIIRPSIDGNVPMALITAPQKGTGKTYLTETISTAVTGRPAAVMSAPRDSEEWRKRITSSLLDGSLLIVLDNVAEALEAPELSQVLTARTWKDRKLGANETITVPAQAIWIATANNIEIGGDLVRRCFQIRLDAKLARPWERDGWKHPDLLRRVRENRGRIVHSVLTMARAWHAAGKPPATTVRLNGFNPWVEDVGGILAYAGVEGFLANQYAMEQSADPEDREWEVFLLMLMEQYRGRAAKAKEIEDAVMQNSALRDVLPAEIMEKTDGLTRKVSTVIGRLLKKRKDRRHGASAVRVVDAGEDPTDKVRLWRFTAGGPGDPGG